MSDPIIDSINQPASKHFWRSKTIWGLITLGVSLLAPKYQPIAQALPPAAQQIGEAVGALIALYGRIKTDGKPIKNPFSK